MNDKKLIKEQCMEDKNKEKFSDGDFFDIVGSCFGDDFVSSKEVDNLINTSGEDEEE